MPSVSPETRSPKRRRCRSRSMSRSPVRSKSSNRKSDHNDKDKSSKHRKRSRERNDDHYRDDNDRSSRMRPREDRRFSRRDFEYRSSSHRQSRDGDNHRERPRESSSDPENRSRFNERKRNRPMKKEVKEFGKPEVSNSRKSDSGNQPKEQPNFNVSGKLAEDTNVFNGVVIKYNEPIEARKPNKRWRLYPFKGNEPLPMLPIHRQSAYLLGRERRVADIPIDHPSCSKQHAVLQFRLVPYTREDGTNGRRIRPYIIDLDSANGTFLNNKRIEPRRYVEILERDILKFGFSSREYVLLHEESVAAADDDDESEMPTETAEAEQS